uniref:uncharacterized protein LOC105350051 n=1 Tax=Fragaria vesca subsp. vesca TaxID=101020 RepID=UPI0005C8D1CE|nr:PREDICTED: uncharacterized protein LOC105350051 [Fragaria vesca subsp. vesca]
MSNSTANPEELVNTKETAHDQQQAKSAKKQVVLNNRSQLKNLCEAYKLKQPVYECCKEEGPSHLRMFTFKASRSIWRQKRNPQSQTQKWNALVHRIRQRKLQQSTPQKEHCGTWASLVIISSDRGEISYILELRAALIFRMISFSSAIEMH